MKLVLFTHYSLFKTASMPRFAGMIADGMRERGHTVEDWPCPVILGNKARHPFFAKWLGYIDQFILFPRIIRRRLKCEPKDTLFVITDQALGPWVPLVADRPHVIHCHDFLAQRSALGEFPENPTGFTGKLYQAYIRRGYRKGRNFISVSKRTQEDLHRFLEDRKPDLSEVVYNGLNYPFCPLPADEAIARLRSIPAFEEMLLARNSRKSEVGCQESANANTAHESLRSTNSKQPTTSEAPPRFILHVGGNQWYKNREGVILIYRQYCLSNKKPIPLLIMGRPPSSYIRALTNEIPKGGRVVFVSDATNEQIHAAYVLAQVFLFPSLEEGFGWPIAEAMACGCPVITTDRAPMTEVGGLPAFYLPRKTVRENRDPWAVECANLLTEILNLPRESRNTRLQSGFENASRFNTKKALDGYAEVYEKILLPFSS